MTNVIHFQCEWFDGEDGLEVYIANADEEMPGNAMNDGEWIVIQYRNGERTETDLAVNEKHARSLAQRYIAGIKVWDVPA